MPAGLPYLIRCHRDTNHHPALHSAQSGLGIRASPVVGDGEHRTHPSPPSPYPISKLRTKLGIKQNAADYGYQACADLTPLVAPHLLYSGSRVVVGATAEYARALRTCGCWHRSISCVCGNRHVDRAYGTASAQVPMSKPKAAPKIRVACNVDDGSTRSQGPRLRRPVCLHLSPIVSCYSTKQQARASGLWKSKPLAGQRRNDLH